MDGYLQAAAGVLLTVIMVLALGKEGKQIALLLVLAACAMVGIMTLGYLEPVVGFMKRLSVIGSVNGQMLGILLKVVGIGLIGEIAGLICTDSGNASLGKVLQILSAALILRIALPLFEELLDLLEHILGEV